MDALVQPSERDVPHWDYGHKSPGFCVRALFRGGNVLTSRPDEPFLPLSFAMPARRNVLANFSGHPQDQARNYQEQCG